MKRIGCIPLHYGKEYLAWSVDALATACDEVHVFYSPTPSFGFSGPLPCPDTEEELHAEANRFAKPVWHRVSSGSEGNHNEQMLEEARSRGAHIVAIADADEIWDPLTLAVGLASAYMQDCAGRWRTKFRHFWRSWKWSMVDHFEPIRIRDLRHPSDVDGILENAVPIFHFGYAQRPELIRYKLTCTSHQPEFKPSWFDGKYLAWKHDDVSTHTDLHPVIDNFWTAQPTPADVLAKLDVLMPTHPYRDLDLIT